MNSVRCWILLLLAIMLLRAPAAMGRSAAEKQALQNMVEADWAAQEHRKNRAPESVTAVREAYQRAQKLLADLHGTTIVPDTAIEQASIENLQSQIDILDSLNKETRLELYLQIRSSTRNLALKNPLLAAKPIVFMKRRRFICQMLHEYLGYFYDYGDIEGGGIYILEKPGISLEVRDLIQDRLPPGNYTTLSLSYDVRKIYFAFAERAPKKPDYYSPERRCFHIYVIDADGDNLHQLTDGPYDDFDPCPLPDGGVAFMSTRRGGFGRCHNPWEPLPSYTLHRMDATGANLRTLSFHETNEWHPSVLADGRIVYARWDYVDRSAANYHGLWISNPDGTNPSVLFGNYTQRINACYQPRQIPGSNKVVFIAGAHHANVGGSLVVFDPSQEKLDTETGQDRFDGIEVITPEVCFPEAPGWPASYFHSPWPLSENYFLVSFSFEALPGMGPRVEQDTSTGLYYFDRFGNMELLYRDPDISCMYPIPFVHRPRPAAVPSAPDPNLSDKGEFVLIDVKSSLFPLPSAREIRKLRIFQVLPKTTTHIANKPRLGYANAESARMMLGTVPVEADGSAYFRAPACKPLYFQAVDESERAVQSMRSITYLQPGERRTCLGCHEPRGTAPPGRQIVLALQRPPSKIKPGPDGTRPFSFLRLVQPVLDRHCVRCHDGKTGDSKSTLVLTGEPTETFSKSYNSLKQYVKWYEWGGKTITEIITRPGNIGADKSPLLKIMEDTLHSEHLKLGKEDLLRLNLWLDGNAPFYGVYEPEQQLAQQQGQIVLPPTVQ